MINLLQLLSSIHIRSAYHLHRLLIIVVNYKNIPLPQIQDKSENPKCKGEVAGKLRQANNMLARGLFNSPLAISTIEKVQADRFVSIYPHTLLW